MSGRYRVAWAVLAAVAAIVIPLRIAELHSLSLQRAAMASSHLVEATP